VTAINPDDYTGLLLRKEGRVLHAELHNPGRKNALNPTMLADLQRLWTEVDQDDDVHVVVLSGHGDAFCAGIDLKNLSQTSGPEKNSVRRLSVKSPRDTFWRMLDCETPIISKVRGPAYGLGVNICLSADIVIASENARFCDSHVKNGIAPGDGGAALWPLLIGFHRAKEYIMLGDVIEAQKAAEMGLINHCVPDEELDAVVDKMADRIADGAPMAIAFAKLSVNVMLKQLMAGAFETSMAYDMLTLKSNDVREGSSAFVEKRAPKFTGT
jgi:enoyl-CoA hydratase